MFDTMWLFIPALSILLSGRLGYAASDFDSMHEDSYLGDTKPVSTSSDFDIYHDSSVKPTIPGQPVEPASSDELTDDVISYEISDFNPTSSEKPVVTIPKAKKSSFPVLWFPQPEVFPVPRIPNINRRAPVCDPVWFMILCCIGGRNGIDMEKCRYCTCFRPLCLFRL